jgi:hypothetical protein
MDNLSDIDCYLDLKGLSAYSALAVPTLRDYLKDITKPLPHFKVKGKILVKKSEFDHWLEVYRVSDSRELNNMVDTVIERFKV